MMNDKTPNSTQLVPRSRNDRPSSRHVQRADVVQVTDETEVGLVPWVLQVKDIDHCVLSTCNDITCSISFCSSDKKGIFQ